VGSGIGWFFFHATGGWDIFRMSDPIEFALPGNTVLTGSARLSVGSDVGWFFFHATGGWDIFRMIDPIEFALPGNRVVTGSARLYLKLWSEYNDIAYSDVNIASR
jgi:hypothetical protein